MLSIAQQISKDSIELLLWCFLIFGAAVGVIWLRTATVKATYQYTELENQLMTLQQESQEQRVRWLNLNSPERLEELAANLELYPPAIDKLLKYENPKEKGRLP